eukprot:TRINITY_DN15983_c0_g2_i2.p1 TRINITY_DN15983_c0_g2~~TRINITY_DN15983_c0_g2_i2.p1  ORF type:complete len:275 (-),score=81.97 TRINITY_DN15983_c0_g2_i2:22-846(-)
MCIRDRCMLSIYIQNASQLNIPIKKLLLLVHSKRLNKTKLLRKFDLASLLGENLIQNKWYEIKYNAVISEELEGYVFEFQFAAESEVVVERREVGVAVESASERRREELPSVRCIKWDWLPKTEWPEALQLARKALKNKKRIFCCSELMRIVVELQNQCGYNFSLKLCYEDKSVTELELESWNNKSLAAEIPYDVMLRDKVTLEWEILGSFRKGKNLLTNFVSMKDKIPMVTFLPIRIRLEAEAKQKKVKALSLIHICRCRRIERCRSRWSPYH